ncbi:MAG: threonine/serine dehydratase [Chloroflexi bacterium]|nr:threonine/serine dehydratase [Chloroflexota bacterium]
MNSTPQDVVAAQQLLGDYLVRTPLIYSPPLSQQTGAEVWLKCECFAEVGSFKARGALNCILQLSPAQRAQGLICASTGNHGAAMAWAATKVGASCVVVVPHGTPEIKLRNMHNAGASVVIDGGDWGESCVIARRMAAERHLLYLEDGEDPFIMAGAGTVALEVIQQLPHVTDMLVPVGGGNLIAGCAMATKAAGAAQMRLFGVQSDAAPAVTESMRTGQIVQRPTTSFAGGIATTAPVPEAFAIMQHYVDDMLLVPEGALYTAIGQLVRQHGFVVEGAGAAPVAALLHHAPRFLGRTVVLVLSGRNLDVPSLQCALAG